MSKRFALLVGVSSFDDPALEPLRSPRSDIERLAAVLRNSEIGNYSVETLLDADLRKASEKIQEFFYDRQRGETAMFYFAGHGVKGEDGQLYFPFKDSKTRLLDGTAMSSDFLRRQLNRSSSKQQIIVLDCCFGAAFVKGARAAANQVINVGEELGGEGTSRIIMTASSRTQYAQDRAKISGLDIDSSVFSRHLISGLESGDADLDFDGEISTDDIFHYVRDKVIAETPNQEPKRYLFGEAGRLSVARSPQAKTSLPPEVFGRLYSFRERDQLAAIEQLGEYLPIVKPEVADEICRRLTGLDSERQLATVRAAALEAIESYTAKRAMLFTREDGKQPLHLEATQPSENASLAVAPESQKKFNGSSPQTVASHDTNPSAFIDPRPQVSEHALHVLHARSLRFKLALAVALVALVGTGVGAGYLLNKLTAVTTELEGQKAAAKTQEEERQATVARENRDRASRIETQLGSNVWFDLDYKSSTATETFYDLFLYTNLPADLTKEITRIEYRSPQIGVLQSSAPPFFDARLVTESPPCSWAMPVVIHVTAVLTSGEPPITVRKSAGDCADLHRPNTNLRRIR